VCVLLTVIMQSTLITSITVVAQENPIGKTTERLSLMPVPASMKVRPGRLPVTSSFTVITKGYVDDRLRSAINRTIARLAGRTVLSLPYAPATDERLPR
jgi:hypothetical protein